LNLIDITKISTQGLRERKFRFILNLIGILIGCTAVTGLISLTQGLNETVEGQLEMFGPDNIMVMPGSLEMGAGIIASQSFGWREVDTLERIAGIEVVTPVIGNKMAKFTKHGDTKFAFVYGIEAEYFEIMASWEVIEGRHIRRGDSAVIVVGHEIAYPRDMDKPLLDVGDKITLNVLIEGEEKTMSFRVIGILEKQGGLGGMSSDEDNSVFIPLRTCQQLYEEGGTYHYIAAKVEERELVPQVVYEVEEKMGDEVTVMSAETMREMVGSILGAIEAVLGGVAAISLLVAGVGIINTMTISVMERTREIGILKAIGAKSLDVLFLFLSEAVVTGLFGGLFGASVGFLLSNLISKAIDMPASTSINLGLGVVMFAMTTSALSGVYPAWRAANLNPVEALRSE
jgi:putative ABC transport system permease protein